MRQILFIVFSCVFFVNAEAHQEGDDVMNQMRQFHPESMIEGFTDSPKESVLSPKEGDDENWLLQQAMTRASQDKEVQLSLEVASLPKLTPNLKTEELQYAEKLLNQEEDEVALQCHYEPVPCESTYTEKKCEEQSIYSPNTCENKLQVKLHRIDHPEVKRGFIKNLTTIDLTSCAPYPKGIYCSDALLFKLNPKCAHLEMHITIGNQEIALTQIPTCISPIFSFVYPGNAKSVWGNIHLVEYWSEDSWEKENCVAKLQDKGFCIPDKNDPCLDSNQTKMIDGVPVTRACWGEQYLFQCTTEMSTTCIPLIDEGCSNSHVTCLSEINGHCDHLERTFQCSEKICFPDKWVCPEKPDCIGDDCDKTVDEYASQDDVNEGISRLGVLAETAHQMSQAQPDVSSKINRNTIEIFKGTPFKCASFPLNLHDCCTGDGLLDGILHCPDEFKELQRAKYEKRVEKVGEYNDGFLDSKTQHVFCIFPSKLAGIIQLGGRKDQLHIPFGTPKQPDCRGVTALELEKLDFSRLDISGLVTEMTAKKVVPNDEDIKAANVSHVNALNEKGQAHD